MLPGVTVTGPHTRPPATRSRRSPTSAAIYRIPVRVGAYQITAELQGFGTVTRNGVQLLVGQTAVDQSADGAGGVAGNGDGHRRSAAIDDHDVESGGNIDPQQVQELPVQGRNWMALALLAPGQPDDLDQRATTPLPDQDGGDAREFQLNVDGQQVTRSSASATSPATARIRSRSSSSSRTASTRRRAARPACR